MARKPYSERLIVEDCFILSIKDLNDVLSLKECFSTTIYQKWKQNELEWGISIKIDKINNQITLRYKTNKYNNKWEWHQHKINLLKQPCNFGNYRWYFECPACGRKIYRLCMPNTLHIFLCRNCHNLTYQERKKHNKNLDAYKDLKLAYTVEYLLFSGKVKERNKAKSLLQKSFS